MFYNLNSVENINGVNIIIWFVKLFVMRYDDVI